MTVCKKWNGTVERFKHVSSHQVSKKLSREQVDAVFAKFDKDSDGKLSKEEFRQLMVSMEYHRHC